MAYKMTMTQKEKLVELIENILNTDLDFLLKLAPEELRILATSLKELVGENFTLMDYLRKSTDF
jgi:hypothetical protein